MSDAKEEKYFLKWFKKNEKRFHHGQFTDEQIAYSAFVCGYNYNSDIVENLKQQNAELIEFIEETISMTDSFQTERDWKKWREAAVKLLEK